MKLIFSCFMRTKEQNNEDTRNLLMGGIEGYAAKVLLDASWRFAEKNALIDSCDSVADHLFVGFNVGGYFAAGLVGSVLATKALYDIGRPFTRDVKDIYHKVKNIYFTIK